MKLQNKRERRERSMMPRLLSRLRRTRNRKLLSLMLILLIKLREMLIQSSDKKPRLKIRNKLRPRLSKIRLSQRLLNLKMISMIKKKLRRMLQRTRRLKVPKPKPPSMMSRKPLRKSNLKKMLRPLRQLPTKKLMILRELKRLRRVLLQATTENHGPLTCQ